VIALLSPGHTYEEAAAAGRRFTEKAGIAGQWTDPAFCRVRHARRVAASRIGAAGQWLPSAIVEFVDRRMHYRVEDPSSSPMMRRKSLFRGPKELADVEK